VRGHLDGGSFGLTGRPSSQASVSDSNASRTGALVAMMTAGRARRTPRDYAALAREVYP